MNLVNHLEILNEEKKSGEESGEESGKESGEEK